MEYIHRFKTKLERFHITHTHNLLFLYTPADGIIDVHNLQDTTLIRHIRLEPFLSFTCTSHILVTTTKTHISGYNAYTGQRELFMYLWDSQASYLLCNKKLVACFHDHLVFYNEYNQEESRYNFDRCRVVDNQVIIYINNLITVFNEDFTVAEEKYIEDEVHDNFTFTVFRHDVAYLNGHLIRGRNFVYDYRWLGETPLSFAMTEKYVFLIIKCGFILFDRREGQNVNLQIAAGLVKRYINPINYGKGVVACESFQVFDKYFVTKEGAWLKSYKDLGVCTEYIEGERTIDYIEAECEFDDSMEDNTGNR